MSIILRESFDMPLSELETYRGTNPRPSDFDAYWEAALSEMRAVEPDVAIEPAAFDAPTYARCDHLWFTGVGGARIHAKLLRPLAARTPTPALLFFHGYGGASHDWTDKLPYVAAGMTVAALDCRGQSGESQETGDVLGWTLRGQVVRGVEDPDPHKLYYRHVYLDAVQLAGLVATLPEVDGTQLATFGFSQGGALSLVCAALEPRVQRVVAGYPFLCDFQRSYVVDADGSASAEVIEWFRRRDPRHERAAGLFERLGYIDVQHLAARITADVHMLTALRDTACPPSTQFAAYNRLTTERQMTLYPDFGHEWLPGAHDIAFAFLTQGLRS